MSIGKVDRTIKDVNGNDIVDMNASWETKAYEMGDYLHLGAHLFWDNPAVTGTMLLQYSCDPQAGGNNVDNWVTKNTVTLDGSFSTAMFLDSHVPVSVFRLKFVRTAGTANLSSYIQRKRGA
jgi:hypothetical protein